MDTSNNWITDPDNGPVVLMTGTLFDRTVDPPKPICEINEPGLIVRFESDPDQAYPGNLFGMVQKSYGEELIRGDLCLSFQDAVLSLESRIVTEYENGGICTALVFLLDRIDED